MLKGKYRYVRYLDDGHVNYQCLTCYDLIPHAGNYCSSCGIKFTERHECRHADVPKYEFEHPEIDFWGKRKTVYSEDKPMYRIYGRSINFCSAKRALEVAREDSEQRMRPVIIYYGPHSDILPKKYVRIDNFTHIKKKIESIMLDMGYKNNYTYGSCWYDNFYIPDMKTLEEFFEYDQVLQSWRLREGYDSWGKI